MGKGDKESSEKGGRQLEDGSGAGQEGQRSKGETTKLVGTREMMALREIWKYLRSTDHLI